MDSSDPIDSKPCTIFVSTIETDIGDGEGILQIENNGHPITHFSFSLLIFRGSQTSISNPNYMTSKYQ